LMQAATPSPSLFFFPPLPFIPGSTFSVVASG
jgi:hypothetical protein